MIWHPYTIQKGSPIPIEIARASGEFLFDTKGFSYIDTVSSWWTSIHGHNRSELIEAARSQLKVLDHVLLAGFSNRPAIDLAAKLIDFTGIHFKAVYYSDNGSCANEIALKIATQYFRNQGNSKKIEFIKFSHSYHGDTIGTMSVGGDSHFNKPFQNLLFPSKEFPSPHCSNCPVGKKKESCKQECVSDLEIYMSENHEKIIGLILEPLIFGACGMLMYKPEVLRDIRRITKKYNIILIYDEVFTGFGRTGKDFAFLHTENPPDILTLAKGLSGGVLPLATTLINEDIYSAFYSEKPEHAFYHGHTMTGNPTACAVALKSIQIYEEEQRLQDVNILEFYLKKFLKELSIALEDKIQHPRTLGAVGAFELQPQKKDFLSSLVQHLLDKGILIRPLGNTIYFAPPYTIQKTSIEKVFEVLGEYLLKNQDLL